jgi:hypothetical protein
MPGWGAYILEKEYKEHIATYLDQSEVNGSFFFQMSITHRFIEISLTDKYLQVTA